MEQTIQAVVFDSKQLVFQGKTAMGGLALAVFCAEIFEEYVLCH